MTSRWELLWHIIDNANISDDYGLLEDFKKICAAGHDSDTFYEQAKADGALMISGPDFEDIVFEILSDSWVDVSFPDYQRPTRRESDPSPDPSVDPSLEGQSELPIDEN